MGGAKGSALEWALALYRSPVERHALRHKPLPEGVSSLIGIAAGSMPDELSKAANLFCESEARVRDAAQFYVREVLFFPNADAYRVLGVGSNASAEQIKAHHRMLQHWLHPDRVQSEDDAVFAARVNGAWNRLRNTERRQAYDHAWQLRHRAPEKFESKTYAPSLHAWAANSEMPQRGWSRYLPISLLLLACMVLISLVKQDAERRPDARDWLDLRASSNPPAEDMLNISMPQIARRYSRHPQSSKFTKPIQSSRSVVSTPLLKAFQPPTSLGQPARRGASLSPVSSLGPVSKSSGQVHASARTALPAVHETPRLTIEAQAHSLPSLPPEVSTSTPSFAKIQVARQTGDLFLKYMVDVNLSPPPIWNSPAIQSSADSLRHELHGDGPTKLGATQWRIGNDAAVLTSGYAMPGQTSANGTLMADLIWRDGRWLVTGMSIERAR